ncbi:MAG: alpha-ketoglutarate-dependent dioxygenase AlkB [Pseudomonadota bacterium]
MDLFDQLDIRQHGTPHNRLPCDGIVHYLGPIFNQDQATEYFNQLLANIPWQHDQVVHANTVITTRRQMALYGDTPFQYTYSGITRTALTWNNTLLALKQRIEEITNSHYNACLLNRYDSGKDRMSWHSDNEHELVPKASIASLSLGSVRRFSFKHKRSPDAAANIINIMLENGSLLIMKGDTQSHWLHQLPPTESVCTPRINLTFRQMRT